MPAGTNGLADRLFNFFYFWKTYLVRQGGRDENEGPYEGYSSPHDGPVVCEYERCKVLYGSRRARSHRPRLSTVEPRMMAGRAPLRLNKVFVLTLHIAIRICHSNLQCSLRNLECALFIRNSIPVENIEMNNHLSCYVFFNTGMWLENLFLNVLCPLLCLLTCVGCSGIGVVAELRLALAVEPQPCKVP